MLITKRNGEKEKYDKTKLEKWAIFACKNTDIDFNDIIEKTSYSISDGTKSEDIHKTMIHHLLLLKTEDGQLAAGRLLASLIYKDVFGSNTPKSLKSFYKKMVKGNRWVEMSYNYDELEYLNDKIIHSRDFETPYPIINQMMVKYLLSDKKTGKIYETPQMMFMGIAMASMESQPKERRIKDVVILYHYLSKRYISVPTPILVNMRTNKKKYASCCVVTTNDTADSILNASHIASVMTRSSAGIGHNLMTRSVGDGISDNTIIHGGKIPYLREIESVVNATKQGERGGAATSHFTCLDPEIMTLLRCNNPRTVANDRVRGLNYSFGYNKFFLDKVAANEDFMLVSYKDAPELWDLLYSPKVDSFRKEYKSVLNNNEIKKTFVKARDILLLFWQMAKETGLVFEYKTDLLNKQTPFKDKIYSSNLCVAPETYILTDRGYKEIKDLRDKTTYVWNGEEFSKTVVRKTGENQKLSRVTITGANTTSVLYATEYHKFLVGNSIDSLKEVPLKSLCVGDEVLMVDHMCDTVNAKVVSIDFNARVDNTYCFNEPKKHRGVFNGILTSQCQEIGLPTKGYDDITFLYKNEDCDGEIGLCTLAAIPAGVIPEEEKEDIYYYTLLLLDNLIDYMEYPLPHLEYTAKKRRSLGVGITNLAHYVAMNKVIYGSEESKELIHDLAEEHSYLLHKASLQLAKERGVCEWIYKTKYKNGYAPHLESNNYFDCYRLKQDWESLFKEMKEIGGIRHSVLEAHMPCESSSVANGTLNGLYPIRDKIAIKENGKTINVILAPDYEELKDFYKTSWEVEMKDLIEIYGIVQKFTGQAISADLYLKEDNLKSSEYIELSLLMYKVGMKTRYYLNSKVSIESTMGNTAITDESDVYVAGDCDSGGCKL